MVGSVGGYRKQGTGSVRKRHLKPGFEVWSPKRGDVPAKFLTHVDFHHHGVRYLDDWLAKNPR